MKINSELKKALQNPLLWETLWSVSEMPVNAKIGVVALRRTPDSFKTIWEAEFAVKKLIAAKLLVSEIQVKSPNPLSIKNAAIANLVWTTLKFNWWIPKDKISVNVEDAWVTLEGEVSCEYQSKAAKKSIACLKGVRGVTNNIKIKSETQDNVLQRNVENAIARNFVIEGSDLYVQVFGTKISLKGSVSSWSQKEAIERIAMTSENRLTVINELQVNYLHKK